jgi:hypothetical protein
MRRLYIEELAPALRDNVATALGEDSFVDENQMRPKGFRPLQNLGRILRFGHDTEIILYGEKLLEAIPENALPVSHENAYCSS